MKNPESFWNATQKEIERGYQFNTQDQVYTCLICGETYSKNIIYPHQDILFTARKAIETHITEAHHSMFDYLLNLNKKYIGMSEIQKEFIRLEYKGKKDQEIATIMGVTISTVRNHRFKMKEKVHQAKIQLAISALVKSPHDDVFIPHSPGATMIDDRYQITEAERLKTIATYFDKKQNNRLKSFPAKAKKKIIVLREIALLFKADIIYSEKEVNRILKRIFDDHVSIRRALIEYGMMERTQDCNQYWIKN